ncbi:MAG: hypothetical protein IPN76_09435 [Saprospiraceae bacterium]|nr:hypothetical protein [Saprospiraceae bacterium]
MTLIADKMRPIAAKTQLIGDKGHPIGDKTHLIQHKMNLGEEKGIYSKKIWKMFVYVLREFDICLDIELKQEAQDSI